MSFKSLHDVLGALQSQAQWQDAPLQKLLKCWPDVVGVAVAAHTRPVSIGRDVLHVATSSAAWAQNLTFERQRLLEKVNAHLPTPIVDIRFSTAEWHSGKAGVKLEPKLDSQAHPSFLGDVVNSPGAEAKVTAEDAKAAFKSWAERMRMRSYHLPLCPQCHSPTPPGELQRWQICAVCAAKSFQDTSETGNRGEEIMNYKL